MRDFLGRTAVVTGAGSGIGAAIARRCAHEGMNIVLADVSERRLAEQRALLSETGVRVLTVQTDVSSASDVDQLANTAFEEFGEVHLLCNNAGVLHVAPLLEHTAADWDWVLGVNLLGVINGIRSFGSLMADQPGESHIVNTASLAAFTTGPGLAAYKVTKHAVLALSEVLYYEMSGTRVGVSVLCPGWVDTGIMDAEELRRSDLKNPDDVQPTNAEFNRERGRKSAKAGASPLEIADALFEAIGRGDFYVIPDASFEAPYELRVQGVLARRNPGVRSL